MSKHKHTPGPWRVSSGLEGEAAYISSEHHGYVPIPTPFRERAFLGKYGEGLVGTDTVSVDEIRANAKLIAAAPDLLEACEAALACHSNDDEGQRLHPELLGMLQAAIRKATN